MYTRVEYCAVYTAALPAGAFQHVSLQWQLHHHCNCQCPLALPVAAGACALRMRSALSHDEPAAVSSRSHSHIGARPPDYRVGEGGEVDIDTMIDNGRRYVSIIDIDTRVPWRHSSTIDKIYRDIDNIAIDTCTWYCIQYR